jgi:hypothetical protein
MSAVNWDRLAGDYPTHHVLRLLSKEDLLLYLSHFKSTDPNLMRVEPIVSTPKPSSRLTLESRPKMVPGIVRSTVNFDLSEMLNQIASRDMSAVQSSTTRIIFNPNSRKLRSVGPNVSELLGLLSGGRTIRLIAQQLAKKQVAPEAAVQAFCLDSLNQLASEGYVEPNI